MRAALAALALAAGCAPSPGAQRPIVTLGEEAVLVADFESFLASSAGFAPSPSPAVLSALLDDFVEERLLALGARDAGIRVSAMDVVAEMTVLAAAPTADEAAGPDSGSLEEGVRRRLLVRRFLDEAVLADLEISDEEVALELEADEPLYRRPEILELSEAMFRTRAEADEAAAALGEDPDSPGPEFRRVGVFQEGELPETIAAAVRGLDAGEFSGAIGTATGFGVFRVDRREDSGPMDPDEAGAVARRAILERRANERIADALRDLRARYPVVVYAGRLPFPYLGREAAEDAP